MLKLLSLFALVSVISGVASAADLKIATSADYPPWESVNQSGEIVGFDHDFGEALCERMSETCTWTNQSFSGLLPGLEIGKFDMVIAALSITKQRAKQVDFSTTYVDAPSSFVVAKGSPITSAKTVADLRTSLKGKSIGAQTGSIQAQAAKANFPDSDIHVYERANQLAADIVAGRIDAGFMVQSAWTPLLEEYSNKLKPAGPGLTGSDFPKLGGGKAVALRKGNQSLQDKADKAIKAMLKDGTIRSLSKKWFGHDLSPEH